MAATGHKSGPKGKRSQSSTGGSTSVCVKRVTFSPAPPPLGQLSSSASSHADNMAASGAGMRHKSSSSSSTSSCQSPPVELKRKRKPRFGRNVDGASSRPLLDKPGKRKGKRVWPAAPASSTRSVATEEHDGGHQLPSECPDSFGVKSYLHHFYENVAVKNPDLYEELQGGNVSSGVARGGYRYLLEPPKKLKCRSLWWKTAVWSGVFILIVGVVIILVGYLLPRRPVVVAGYSDSLEVVDRAALRYNSKLDTCKLSGLIVFCVGGAVVAIALLIPSFFYNYCDEDWSGGQASEPPFKVRTDSLDDDDDEDGEDDDEEEEDEQLAVVLSPTEKKVPVTEELMRIQPEWGGVEEMSVGSKETLITTDTLPPTKLIR